MENVITNNERTTIPAEKMGKYAIYARNPRTYGPNGELVISLPLRPGDYALTQTGSFFGDFVQLFLASAFVGDIFCLQENGTDEAYFLSEKGWRKLRHFAPEDLPWRK